MTSLHKNVHNSEISKKYVHFKGIFSLFFNSELTTILWEVEGNTI